MRSSMEMSMKATEEEIRAEWQKRVNEDRARLREAEERFQIEERLRKAPHRHEWAFMGSSMTTERTECIICGKEKWWD